MNLPIGYDNFRDLIDQGLNFVDKSLLIKDFLDNKGAQVTLVTRPRRFGKTLNLSMLHHFFASQAYGKSTKDLFIGLQIMQQSSQYLQHQGKYPVIALTFKDVKDGEFRSAYANLVRLLSRAYREHIAILDSPRLTSDQKYSFQAILKCNADESQVQSSLLDLTDCLYQHYGEKVILLLDEYDTPIISGYLNGYYDKIIGVMRHLFGAALKSNPYLFRAMLTGILRVSKESLFSGLNNLEVYSLLRSEYSQYFGFTDEEVVQLLNASGLTLKREEIRQWYNGYQVGNTVIYNPWSIVNCIKQKGLLQTYWVNTSGNDLIKKQIMRASVAFKSDFELLLQNIAVERLIDENFVFVDLDTNESAVWSLLLASGYLKAQAAVPEGTLVKCQLLSPNQEVLCLYKDIVKGWFIEKLGQGEYQQFLASLLQGKVADFTKMLKNYLLESASQFDVKGKHPEKFYHGFVLGLIAGLEKTHVVRSNRESGYGRYDVMIIPKDKSQRGIILEFKSADETEDLATVAEEALKQLQERGYETELRQEGITIILKLGLAFHGKDVASACS
jgi:hypothetical protein